MNLIEELAEEFRKMPGIGIRQARRIVTYLLRQKDFDIKKLSEKISNLKSFVKKCVDCNLIFNSEHEAERCKICRNKNRNDFQIMIVANDIDLETIEKSGAYDGRYYVLGSYLNIGSEIDYEKWVVKNLMRFLKSRAKLEEIIFALSATPDADYTCEYLVKKIRSEKIGGENLRITKLGRGLSTGTEIEYSDTGTIENAFKNRS